MQRKLFLTVILLIIAGSASAQRLSGVDGVDAPHGDAAKLTNLCADCHYGYNTPNAPASVNDKCLSCHNGTAAPAAESHRGLSCTTCHNPHHQEQAREYGSTYSKLVKTSINLRTVKLTGSSGHNSFADGDATRDGVCEVCHSTTRYHRNDGSGEPHNNGSDCTTCHPHDVGFSGAGGGSNCLGCHQTAMGSRRAVGPDFSAAGPHHPLTFNSSGNLESPSENNCLICHSDYPGLHGDGAVDLNPDPDNSGSQEWLGIYNDPWCMDCHDGDNPDPNYRLGGKTATDKKSFFSASNAHANGTALSGNCTDCHNRQNMHTVSVKFYSNFYLDDNEENACYGCHGGAANVNTGGRYMENIRVAYTSGMSRSKHSAPENLNTGDGKVFCRNCHDPHLLNHTTNLLIDPLNNTAPWTGQRIDFCFQCHTRETDAVHGNHSGVSCNKCHNVMTMTIATQCTECHLPHSSGAPKLLLIDIAGKSLSVSPPSASVPAGSSQQFNSVPSPGFPEFTQGVINNFTDWSFVTSSGGSTGNQYSKTETIPLDRSVGYDPGGNGGWGLITVSSSMTVPDNITIEDIDLYFNATHHYRGDIDLTLTHVPTGRSVRVQQYDWYDWAVNLDFWYSSESPNPPHGDLSPRSTAESLTAFNGESAAGEWRLTVLDTWPSDNSTDPASPDYCKVNSWGLKINGNVIGSFTGAGLFQSSYAGSGTVYAKLHNGKLYPAQSGLDVGVTENPPPLQATSLLAVTSPLGIVMEAERPVEIPYDISREKAAPKKIRQPGLLGAGGHRGLEGRACLSCHGR